MLISEDPEESCKGHTYPALNSCLGLDPREAIVIYGQMPPTDPTSGRVFSFSALGDIVNNVVMQQKSGEDPFGKARYRHLSRQSVRLRELPDESALLPEHSGAEDRSRRP